MRRIFKRTAKIAITVLVVLLAVVYLGVSYLMASGLSSVERKELEDHPTAHGLEFEDVSFVSRKGDVTLAGWYIPGETDEPTIIFVHGINSNRTGDEAMGLAARLVGLGYNILMFDQRAHGESGGDKSTYGYHERFDVLGALDYLASRGLGARGVGVLGLSMGAGTAVLAAAEEPALQGLVADSPYGNGTDLIVNEVAVRTDFPRWIIPLFVPGAKQIARTVFGVDIGKLSPEVSAAALNYPILVIHGTADTRIPPDHGERVREAVQHDSQIWLVPGVEHVDSFTTYPDEYVRRVAEYFESRLAR